MVELLIDVSPLGAVYWCDSLIGVALPAGLSTHKVFEGLRDVSITDVAICALKFRVPNNLGEVGGSQIHAAHVA